VRANSLVIPVNDRDGELVCGTGVDDLESAPGFLNGVAVRWTAELGNDPLGELIFAPGFGNDFRLVCMLVAQSKFLSALSFLHEDVKIQNPNMILKTWWIIYKRGVMLRILHGCPSRQDVKRPVERALTQRGHTSYLTNIQ